jgi:HK97 family phage major capsid protein
MSKALELRTARGEATKEMTQLVEKTPKLEGASLARWTELDNIQKNLKVQIDQIEHTEQLDAEMRTIDSVDKPQIRLHEAEQRVTAANQVNKRVKEIQSSPEYRAEFDTYLRSGNVGSNMQEMRVYSGLGDAAGAQGVTLVPIGFQKELETRMRAIGGIRQISKIVTTATGNTLHWPTQDDTSNIGHWVAEGAAVSQTNPAFSEVLFYANLGSSDQVLASVQLLQDSAFDVEQFLADDFALRLARLTETAYAVGTGSGQPEGLLTALEAAGSDRSYLGTGTGTPEVIAVGAYSNDGVSTDINSVGSDDIDNLIENIDPAYRPGSTFVAQMSTYDALRKVKDKFGRSIWSAGLAEKEPDRLRGYAYVYDQYGFQTIGANNVSMAFGNFSKYIIRDVLGFQLVRFNELFMSSHQVGFQAYLRTDGNCIRTQAFAYLQHPSS